MMIRTLLLTLFALTVACTTGAPLTGEEPENAEQAAAPEEETPEQRPQEPGWYGERNLYSESDKLAGYAAGGASDEQWLMPHLEREAVSELRYRIDGEVERVRESLASEMVEVESPAFLLALRRAVAQLDLQTSDHRVESLTGEGQIHRLFVRVSVPAADVRDELESALSDDFPEIWQRMSGEQPIEGW